MDSWASFGPPDYFGQGKDTRRNSKKSNQETTSPSTFHWVAEGVNKSHCFSEEMGALPTEGPAVPNFAGLFHKPICCSGRRLARRGLDFVCWVNRAKSISWKRLVERVPHSG